MISPVARNRSARLSQCLFFLLLALSALALRSAGASGGTALATLSGQSMGTTWSVKAVLPEGVSEGQASGAVQRALDLVVAQMSTWEPGSDISRLNRAPSGWHAIPPEFFNVLQQAMRLARNTNGAYDPTVGPLVDLWGFGAPAHVSHPPSDADIAAERARIGWQRIMLDAARSRVNKPAGMHLDLSSIAKGYGVDLAARALDGLGVQAYLVEVGGELRGRGRRPDGLRWHVAIEQPPQGAQERSAIVIPLDRQSVATSGDYRRYFVDAGRRYSHIIDPRTGYPVGHALASVTVIHPDCMQADALATALTVLGPEAGMDYAREHHLAALFIVAAKAGFEQHMTPAFAAIAREE